MDGRDGANFAPCRANDDAGRFEAALGHVDVRERVVADQRVGGAHAERRVVAVQVLHEHQRTIEADTSAESRHDIAVGVVDSLGDHRAVQIEQHAVDRTGIGQALEQFVLYTGVRPTPEQVREAAAYAYSLG